MYVLYVRDMLIYNLIYNNHTRHVLVQYNQTIHIPNNKKVHIIINNICNLLLHPDIIPTHISKKHLDAVQFCVITPA